MSLKRSESQKTSAIKYALTIALYSAASVLPVHAAGEAGWLLDQEHREAGKFIAYVTKDAIKLVFAKGWCVLAKAPENLVYVFRPTEKVIWIGTAEDLSPSALFNPFRPPRARKSLPVVIMKAAKHYQRDDNHQFVEVLGTGKKSAIEFTEYSTVTQSNRKLVFRTTKDIKTAPVVIRLLSRLYEIPDVGSLPIYVRSNAQGNKTYVKELEQSRDIASPRITAASDHSIGPVMVLETKGIRQSAIEASALAVPQGYTQKKDILDITYSSDQKSELQNLLMDIGFTKQKAGSGSMSTPVGKKSRRER